MYSLSGRWERCLLIHSFFGSVGLASVTSPFIQPDDVPFIVNLECRNGKPGEVRVCLNLQLHESRCKLGVILFSPLWMGFDVRADMAVQPDKVANPRVRRGGALETLDPDLPRGIRFKAPYNQPGLAILNAGEDHLGWFVGHRF